MTEPEPGSLWQRVRRWTFWPMLQKEFIQMRRDRLTLGMMVGIPAIQLALFGFAIRTEVRHLPTLVLDEAQSRESRELIATLVNSTYFDIVGTVRGREEVATWIGRGDAAAAVIIPHDFTRDIKRRRGAQAQVIVDAADPLSSAAALQGAAQAGLAFGAGLTPARPPVIELRVRPWYNPMLTSSTYIVPGIIGVLLSLTMVIITGMAVVRERERGTLEQLIVTPIDRTSLMLGKIVPFLLVGYVQITVIILLGRLLFDVPLRGSLPLLYVMAFPFIVASLGVGLYFSTLVRTQAQAMQAGFMFILPNILLSGFMFPRAAMPLPAQWLGLLLPLTYFLEVLRGILLRGVGASALWPELLALCGFAVCILTLSVRRFHKTLD
ncbi:MAG: ABC transporter permease [Gemmatimonadota bacterium]|nr:ABC transporter permease [Gemmatimonadota bacterium]